MKTKSVNAVMAVQNYEECIAWYQEAFDLEVIHQVTGDYSYTELGQDGQNIVGLTPASELNHTPTTPRNNSCVLQVQVEDIYALYQTIKRLKTEIRFGPTAEEGTNFLYGSISDPEGNEIWINAYKKKDSE